MMLRHKLALLGLASVAAVGVGPLAFAANPGNIQAGSTVVAWKYTYQGGGVGNVVVLYSNNQHAALGFTGSWVSNSTTWTNLDSVEPLLAAVKHGYAYQVAGAFPSGIGLQYSSDVAAAMTVQNFNPSEVGGQPLAPSSSVLTSSTESWLTSSGWGSALTSYQASQTSTSTTPTTQQSTPPSSQAQPTTTQTSQPPTTKSTSTSVVPKSSTTPVAPHTSQATTPKSLPVTTKTTPVALTPSSTSPSASVPLPPTTPYLAHHHVARSHAVVAGAAVHHKASHHHAANPWPWIVGGIVVVGGGLILFARRRA